MSEMNLETKSTQKIQTRTSIESINSTKAPRRRRFHNCIGKVKKEKAGQRLHSIIVDCGTERCCVFGHSVQRSRKEKGKRGKEEKCNSFHDIKENFGLFVTRRGKIQSPQTVLASTPQRGRSSIKYVMDIVSCH